MTRDHQIISWGLYRLWEGSQWPGFQHIMDRKESQIWLCNLLALWLSITHLNPLNFNSNDIWDMSEIVSAFLPFRPILIEIISITAYCKINSCYSLLIPWHRLLFHPIKTQSSFGGLWSDSAFPLWPQFLLLSPVLLLFLSHWSLPCSFQRCIPALALSAHWHLFLEYASPHFLQNVPFLLNLLLVESSEISTLHYC